MIKEVGLYTKAAEQKTLPAMRKLESYGSRSVRPSISSAACR
jgi:hypothetical protein